MVLKMRKKLLCKKGKSPDIFDFTVENKKGERLDLFIKKKFPHLSRSFIQRLIVEGKVFVEGRALKPAYSLKGGEKIRVIFPPPRELSLRGECICLDILWEDDFLLVVNKPAGMLTHPTRFGQRGTLVNALLFHCPYLSQVGGPLRQGIVHRLDKDTSGLLVIAMRKRNGEYIYNPPATTIMEKGDVLLVLGNFERLERLRKYLETGR